MVDSDSKDASEDDDDERDAPTSVSKVSERLLKVLRERNADEKLVSSVAAKNDAPTQPPPPPSNEADEDESATNVLITDKLPPRRPAPASRPVSDEDQSETLYAITAQTGKTPAVPAVKEPRPKEEPPEGAVSPIAPPLASSRIWSRIWWWAAPLAIAIGIAALASWVLLNHHR